MLNVKEKYIILIDNEPLKKSDAIVLLEWDWYNRIWHAVELLNQGWAEKIIISGWIEDKSYWSFHGKKLYKKILDLGISKKKILLDIQSKNTKEQAIEIMQLCKTHNFKKIILVASHYHQYRAFLAFLKELFSQKLEKKIQIINSPDKSLKWFTENLRWRRFDILENEFKKIETYKEKWDIASYEDAIEYQKRKEKRK